MKLETRDVPRVCLGGIEGLPQTPWPPPIVHPTARQMRLATCRVCHSCSSPACGPGDLSTYPQCTTKDPRNASLETQMEWDRGTGNASMTFPLAGTHHKKLKPDRQLYCVWHMQHGNSIYPSKSVSGIENLFSSD